MADLKGYRCPNCGNMIPISRSNIYKCEYCGSEYEKEDDWLKPLRVEVCEAHLVNLDFKTKLNDVYLKDEQIKEKYIQHTVDGIAHELAKQIVPFMEIRTYKDMREMTTVIAGRVRVAEPNERFNCFG